MADIPNSRMAQMEISLPKLLSFRQVMLSILITRLIPLCQKQASEHGYHLFPSVAIAQACLESGWGTAKKMIAANALMGVKVGKSAYKFGKAWHGAAYNFILWGGYHGVNQILGRMLQPIKDYIRNLFHISDKSKFRMVLDILMTFCLVSYGWMLFYAPNMQFIVDVTKGYFNLGMPYIHQTSIFFFGIGFIILFLKDYKDEYLFDKVVLLEKKHPKLILVGNYLKYTVLSILIVYIGVLGGGSFIYFKF